MGKCVNCAAICTNRAKYLDMEKFVVILETKEVDSMEKLSVAIVDYCIRHSKIKSEKREIYIYGFMLIFADIINFSLVILIGLCLKKFTESVLFLITLCGLRQYSGGFHAKTFVVCRLSMILTYIVVTLVTSFLIKMRFCIYAVILLNAISIVSVSLIAPIENVNKKLSASQKKRNKTKSIIVSIALSLASIFFIGFNLMEEGVTISITLLAVVILMIIGLAAKKGGYSDV